MPLLSILRFIFTLLSLTLLALGLWAAFSWYDDEAYWTVDGSFHVVLVDWRVWLAVLLLAWSFLGKFFWVLLLSRPDQSISSDPTVLEGQIVHSPTGAELNVTTAGTERKNGPVLVFDHGWAMDSSLWFYARRHFQPHYTVVTLDLPGLGRSKSAATISLPGMAEDVLAVIKRIDRPCVLIGHSIGGIIF